MIQHITLWLLMLINLMRRLHWILMIWRFWKNLTLANLLGLSIWWIIIIWIRLMTWSHLIWCIMHKLTILSFAIEIIMAFILHSISGLSRLLANSFTFHVKYILSLILLISMNICDISLLSFAIALFNLINLHLVTLLAGIFIFTVDSIFTWALIIITNHLLSLRTRKAKTSSLTSSSIITSGIHFENYDKLLWIKI